ncbi:HAD-IIIA family hydrolase [Paraflavisolibacter sp. H34]|uniref:HAD-IIIA family hydrolase n=1 Tax=Huijunlia imazamoxiresistens TaxID=3127457 RepID=UPI003015975F
MEQQENKNFGETPKVTEAIILAGGLGTRLRSVVADLPKCMAPVAQRPFLSYVVDYLRMQGVERFIFSLGYLSEAIEAYLAEHYPTLPYTTVVEEEPLGTGGGIQLALRQALTENVVVANGDTLFKVDLKALSQFHRQQAAECTLALKPMHQFDRYGVVETGDDGGIRSFREKQYYAEGLINGGIYLINAPIFLQHGFPEKFSFEKDYLEKYTAEGRFFGCVQEGYFIDIGIPEDFKKAQTDLAASVLDLSQIDKSWTLFLDRDGVINEERVGEYVLNWEQFIFTTGALEAFKTFPDRFGRVLIVSNQRGVGRQLMTEDDLKAIHEEMKREVAAVGGTIDRIYYCTEKDDKCFHRKPNPGMAWQAVNDFPDIDLSRSIMVGNKPSDMRFGRSAGMFTVFVTTTNPQQPFPHPDIDLRFDSLAQFAEALRQ